MHQPSARKRTRVAPDAPLHFRGRQYLHGEVLSVVAASDNYFYYSSNKLRIKRKDSDIFRLSAFRKYAIILKKYAIQKNDTAV
jgi:hypothetical protein